MGSTLAWPLFPCTGFHLYFPSDKGNSYRSWIFFLCGRESPFAKQNLWIILKTPRVAFL
jgi:hypothetical protein